MKQIDPGTGYSTYPEVYALVQHLLQKGMGARVDTNEGRVDLFGFDLMNSFVALSPGEPFDVVCLLDPREGGIPATKNRIAWYINECMVDAGFQPAEQGPKGVTPKELAMIHPAAPLAEGWGRGKFRLKKAGEVILGGVAVFPEFNQKVALRPLEDWSPYSPDWSPDGILWDMLSASFTSN